MSAAAEIALRLRGRAESALRNAEAFERMSYAGEAMLWRARAAAYTTAAEDAELLVAPSQRQPFGARDMRDARGTTESGAIVSHLVQRKEASNG